MKPGAQRTREEAPEPGRCAPGQVSASASGDAPAQGVRAWLGRRLEFIYLAYLLLYPIPWLVRSPTDATALAASAAGIGAFLVLYFYGYSRTGWRLLACAAGILGIGLALQPFGGVWGVFGVYAAAMASYAVPVRRAVVALVAIGTVVLAFSLLRDLPLFEWVPTLFFGALVAISSMYAASIESANRALAASREESRRLAALAERERIARDLHDLLGHTLTVVAVKADLAGKLVTADPEAARCEIDEIRSTARAALADVRAAVTGMRSVTLAAEFAAVRRSLAGAEILLEVEGSAGELPPPVESALAFVLREACTNVVRHAAARRCRVGLRREPDEVLLEIADDGRGGLPVEGNGLRGLRERLAAVGGRLDIESGSGLRLVARVPVEQAA